MTQNQLFAELEQEALEERELYPEDDTEADETLPEDLE